jgi:hypothetical protein
LIKLIKFGLNLQLVDCSKMADELELELSYEGDGNGEDGGYEEEVDYGESEGEEAAAPSRDAIQDDQTRDVHEDRGPASGKVDRKVGFVQKYRINARNVGC